MREDHINHQIDEIRVPEVDQDHLKLKQEGIDIGMMSLIGDTGMIIMITGQIVVIAAN